MTEQDLVRFLRDMGVSKIVSSGGNVRGCCPIHGEDNPSFGVSIHKDGHPWNCFACGNSGLTIRSLCAKVWPELSRAEIERKINAYGGAAVVEFPEMEKDVEKVGLHWFRAFAIADELRDIDIETLQEAEIRYYEKGSVLIPYFVGGDLVGVVVYNWNKTTDVKSFALFGFKNRQYVFYPKVSSHKGSLVLVEGFYDTLKVYDSGVDNVAGVGGATITPNQRREISSLTDCCITVMPDKDAGGSTLVTSVVTAFPNHSIFVADQYDGADPGESTYAGISNALKNRRMVI